MYKIQRDMYKALAGWSRRVVKTEKAVDRMKRVVYKSNWSENIYGDSVWTFYHFRRKPISWREWHEFKRYLFNTLKLLLTIAAMFLLIAPSDPFGKLNEIPAINEGGCGWVAYYLSEQLPGATIEVTGNWYHVFIRWQGRMIDSRGIWGPLFPIRGREVTREQLRDRLMRRELWNGKFDVNDTIKIKNYVLHI